MIKRLNAKHKIIAREVLQGMKQKRIAWELHMSEAHVSTIINSSVFQEHLSELQRRADAEAFNLASHMSSHAKAAATAITDILMDPKAPVSIRLRTANEVIKLGAPRSHQADPGPKELTFKERIALTAQEEARKKEQESNRESERCLKCLNLEKFEDYKR